MLERLLKTFAETCMPWNFVALDNVKECCFNSGYAILGSCILLSNMIHEICGFISLWTSMNTGLCHCFQRTVIYNIEIDIYYSSDVSNIS